MDGRTGVRKPLAERGSALAAELEQREKRAVWVSAIYLAGLVGAPIAALALIIHTAGNLLGAPLIVLVIAALTQRMTHAPTAPGQRPNEDAADDGVVPLLELEAPLESMLERLAGRVGAPMPEVVYLAPEAFAAGWIPTFRWDYFSWSVTWTPALMLGVLPMRAMGRDEFEAVLAHELAHLSRRPSLLSAVFALTQLAAETCLARAAASGFQKLFNPACWWTRLWYRALDRTVIAMGRLEELRADEVAVRAVGADGLNRALDTFFLTLAQIRALAAQLVDTPSEMRGALHAYFEHGPGQLPAAHDPDVEVRRRQLGTRRGTSHPTQAARRFMAAQVKDPGQTLPDLSDAGCVYLLPRAGRTYLPVLVRYLVNARRSLAGKLVDPHSPWAVCHDQRSRLPQPSADGWLPRWQGQGGAPLSAPVHPLTSAFDPAPHVVN